MQSKNVSKSYTNVIVLATALTLLLISRFPSSILALNQEESQNVSATAMTSDIPVYNAPAFLKNAEIRRREGGYNGVSRGIPRGLPRGVQRGLPRGVSRGLPRGVSRGLPRGLPRGMCRGLPRGLPRGTPRGLPRGIPRGEKDNLAQDKTAHGHQADNIPIPSFMTPLAPEQTGLTTQSQPTLYLYISGPWPGKIEFTLNEPKAIEPVSVININGPNKEGIVLINLADYDISLKLGVEYEWFIAIVSDPEERSGDFLGSATIKYVKPSGKLAHQLKNKPSGELYYDYAAAGYWYDAIEKISNMIVMNSDNSALRRHRAALFEQINLDIAAAYDLNGI